eukprot:10310464-Lingulodinium_polyedra.AAC.1
MRPGRVAPRSCTAPLGRRVCGAPAAAVARLEGPPPAQLPAPPRAMRPLDRRPPAAAGPTAACQSPCPAQCGPPG